MATSLLIEQVSRVGVSPRPRRSQSVLLGVARPEERAALEALLGRWGHGVEAVADGAALLQAMERPEPGAVVILDSDLPGLSGVALLHQLQQQLTRRRSWIIALADGASAADRRGAGSASLEPGIDDVLSRPIDELELRASLRAAARVHERYAEMAEAIDAARFQASHDSLTGLLNRESLLNLLFQETDRAQRLGAPLALVLVDLDHFARVNREHGYDGGDRVLRQLAGRFRRFLRSYDLAGRCGGDQFLIAMPGCGMEDARNLATRIRDGIAERPFDILQTLVKMTASVGIAPSAGRSPLTVLREAETALVSAKLAGGGSVRCFPSSAKGPMHLPDKGLAALGEPLPRSVPA